MSEINDAESSESRSRRANEDAIHGKTDEFAALQADLAEPHLERRKSNRFPVHQELRYRVVSPKTDKSEGSGQTIDMSSGWRRR